MTLERVDMASEGVAAGCSLPVATGEQESGRIVRQNLYGRAVSFPSNGLRSREAEVLSLLGCHRYLSREQVEELVLERFNLTPLSRRVVAKRILHRLTQRGLVALTPRLVGGTGGGEARVAYLLTPAGYRLVFPHAPGRRTPSRGTFLMRHALTTTDVALAFRRAASERGHRVVAWEVDSQAAQRLGTGLVIPDAHLVYATAARELDAFIEVDLATERNRFFIGKISRYLELYRSGSWRQSLAVWPLVLTITLSEERALALRRATEALLSAQRDAERIRLSTEFRFGALEHLLESPGPLGEIWQVAGRKGSYPLIREGSGG